MGKHQKGMMKEEDDEENFPANHFHEIENQKGGRRQRKKYKGNNKICLNSFSRTIAILQDPTIVNVRR